jgi:hypothetical protein
MPLWRGKGELPHYLYLHLYLSIQVSYGTSGRRTGIEGVWYNIEEKIWTSVRHALRVYFGSARTVVLGEVPDSSALPGSFYLNPSCKQIMGECLRVGNHSFLPHTLWFPILYSWKLSLNIQKGHYMVRSFFAWYYCSGQSKNNEFSGAVPSMMKTNTCNTSQMNFHKTYRDDTYLKMHTKFWLVNVHMSWLLVVDHWLFCSEVT